MCYAEAVCHRLPQQVDDRAGGLRRYLRRPPRRLRCRGVQGVRREEREDGDRVGRKAAVTARYTPNTLRID